MSGGANMTLKDKLVYLYQDTFGAKVKKQSAKAAILDSFESLRQRERTRIPDDIAHFGYKVYSQNDEDGIIDAIFEKIGNCSTFLEIGVEDGTECNTHLLALKNWRGGWIDGSSVSCSKISRELDGVSFANHFRVIEMMISPDNIGLVYTDHCDFLGVKDVDFFSLDIDGNDGYIVEQLLANGARPKVCCFEYNGKFPPNVAISVNLNHSWKRNDHFGASLLYFCKIMERFDYKLLTCNLTGANVFFVVNELGHLFPDRCPEDVWRPLRLDLSPLPPGHKPSLGFLRNTLEAFKS